MLPDAGSLFALAILIAVTGIVVRGTIRSWSRGHQGGASATGRLAKMEERIQKIEEATSGLVAEFAAVRERERFMTQLVESRARRDAGAIVEASRSTTTTPSSNQSPPSPSPFVVQTVSAARRVAKREQP
jgi:hypothetical protein